MQATTSSQEFESACTRMPDGTIDMEPANLAKMCTILTGKAKLLYRQNKKAARYHVYATKDIKLPAKSAVKVDLGYQIQLKPGLMVHTFAPAGLKGRQISPEGILTTGTDSRVQLINLAAYDQGISKGTTLCSAVVTKAPGGISRRGAASTTNNPTKIS